MTESKGPGKSGGGAVPGLKKRKGPVQRLRPYAVTLAAMAVVFGGSALIGAHVRAHKDDKVSEPNGVAAPAVVPTGPVSTATPSPTAGNQPRLSVPVNPSVPVTITIYEDLRSPESKAFEQEYSPMLTQLLLTGQARLHYRLVTASDAQYGGSGSKVAANAAACAQDQARFTAFVKQVWNHQPDDPKTDKLNSVKLMEKLAKKTGKIQMGKFEPCVEQGDHDGWVKESQADFAAQHLGDVPAVQINDTVVKTVHTTLTPQKLRSMVLKEAKHVIAVQATPAPTPTLLG
ncbi:thioredoxin domain-containing protein [Streptomyces sp. HPF1205]|uniref:thioredoxin domain-containing protein n=1 Tax=Streptomyces sp. HPF1205 TaxID=2873262 RepID=UPI001CED2980|nr:thioredoxin domain-containing protein [Streptomyces sp. HPF1205]